MVSATKRRLKKNRIRGAVATPPLTGAVRLRNEAGFIPGVPSFHEGGAIHNFTEHGSVAGASRNLDFVTQGPTFPRPVPPTFGQQLGEENFLPIPGRPGVFFDLQSGRIIDTNAPSQAAGGGAAPPQFRPGELELLQAQQRVREAQLELDRAINTGDLALRNRAEDNLDQARRRADLISIRQSQLDAQVQQRGQDITAALTMLQLVQQEADSQRRDALARGELELAQAAEQRAQAALQISTQLEQRGQDITVRGQDINSALQTNQLLLNAWQIGNDFAISSGNLQLAQETEQRLRAESQQQVALSQFEAELSSAGLGIQAQTSAAGQAGQLAIGLGNIEARRAEFLSELAANPRDFMQLQFALGGGQNFLNQLSSGQPFEGQSVARAGGTPALGPGFERLTSAVTARPDLRLFGQAENLIGGLAGMAQNVPQAPSLAQLQQLGQLSPLAPAPTGAPPPTFGAPSLPGVPQIPGLQELLAGLGPIPGLPPPVQAPNLGFTPPPQFQFAKGGSLITDEPIVGIGQISGLPRFTVGEGGKPEMLEVTPMQEGGNVLAPFPVDSPAYNAVKAAIGRGELSGGPPQGTPPGPPQPGTVAPPTSPLDAFPVGTPAYDAVKAAIASGALQPGAAPVAPAAPTPAPVPFGPRTQLPMPNVPGATLPPGSTLPMVNPLPPRSGELGEFIITGDGSAFINNPNSAAGALERAEAVGGHGPQMDWLRNLVDVQGQTRQMATPAWWTNIGADLERQQAAPQAPAGPSAEEINRLIRNFMTSMTPQAYNSMTPSQIEMIGSIVSAFGFPPQDFWASVFASWPQGADPSQQLFGTNF